MSTIPKASPSWDCTICTYVNKMTTTCIVCDSWQCTRCTCVNDSALLKCPACNQQKCYNKHTAFGGMQNGALPNIQYRDFDDNRKFKKEKDSFDMCDVDMALLSLLYPSEFPKDPTMPDPVVIHPGRDKFSDFPGDFTDARPQQSTIITAMTAIANAGGKVFTCDCKIGAYCGEHLQLMIFQEYPVRASMGYPESIDDMRYIGSVMNGDMIFAMLNGPRVRTMLSKVAVQYTKAETSHSSTASLPEDAFLVFDSEHMIASIIISKSRYGIEILGPGIEVMKKMYNYVHSFKRPICIEVTISDSTDERKNSGGSYETHGVLLAIIPPTPMLVPASPIYAQLCVTHGRVYLLDPNSCSQVSHYRSKDIENVLKALLPNDPRFAFVPQDTWLKSKRYGINGSYADLGVSSGWCRTISVLMAGLITRRDHPMNPEDVLPYISGLSRELCVIMFDATIRHVVSHLLTVADCEKILSQREKQRLKHEESLKKPVAVDVKK